jgi:hypothetical protein
VFSLAHDDGERGGMIYLSFVCACLVQADDIVCGSRAWLLHIRLKIRASNARNEGLLACLKADIAETLDCMRVIFYGETFHVAEEK